MDIWLCGRARDGAASGAYPLESNQIRVIDGDTIATDGKTIRLVGFISPEIQSPQCQAERALEFVTPSSAWGIIAIPWLPCYLLRMGRIRLSKAVDGAREWTNVTLSDETLPKEVVRATLPPLPAHASPRLTVAYRALQKRHFGPRAVIP